MRAGLSSALSRLPAGLSHGAQCEGTCLEVVGRPPMDPLQAPGMLLSAPAAARQAPLSPAPSLPPSSCSSLPAGCIHFSFETRLGICHGPTAIKLDHLPATPVPRADAAAAGSRKQWRSSRALQQHSLLLAAGKSGQLLNFSPLFE